MATRLLVRCKTADMPGAPHENIPLMADIACQKVWSRNFDKDIDRLTAYGGYFNARCVLLIDNGPVDVSTYDTRHFCWKDQAVVEINTPIPAYIQRMLEAQYQFNPADRPIPVTYTDEELKAKIGEAAYNKSMTSRADQIARYMKRHNETHESNLAD